MIPLLHLVLLWDEELNRWEDLFLFHFLCNHHGGDENRPVLSFNPQGKRYNYGLIYGTDDSPWLQERLLTVNNSPFDLLSYSEYLLSRQSEQNYPTPSLSPALPLSRQ